MRERLEAFALSLHPDKTRLIEFGRHAAARPRAARAGQTGDLQLPGLHLHLRHRPPGQVPRQTEDPARPHAAKLKDMKETLRRRMHQPIPETGAWLGQVVRRLLQLPRRTDQQSGHRGVPPPRHGALATRATAGKPRTKRRGHGSRSSPTTTSPNLASFILGRATLRRHPPEVGAVCGKAARTVLCGGRSAMSVPTAIDLRRHDDESGVRANPQATVACMAQACQRGPRYGFRCGTDLSGGHPDSFTKSRTILIAATERNILGPMKNRLPVFSATRLYIYCELGTVQFQMLGTATQILTRA